MLTAERIRHLLACLSAELERRALTGEVFLVGGAAMVLAYGRDRATRDLDAIFEPKAGVYAAAAAVAEAEGLPADWLNDAVKGFLPGADPLATVVLDLPALRVRVCSPGYLFAMKAAAARADRDSDDLVALYRLCGFSDAEEALDHVEHVLGPVAPLAPRTALLLRELFTDPTVDPPNRRSPPD